MDFIKKHKSLTIILSVIIVFALSVVVAANHYLGKIDYDDGVIQTAPTAPTEPTSAGSTETTADAEEEELDINSLNKEDSQKLMSADEMIRANLDDSKIWYSDDVTNILLMGIDYGGKKYPYGRSDSMIILSIKKATKEIKMISLSRAVYASIPGYANTRLSHAHGYGGAPLAIKAIENNYKIRIDNYASVNFDSFEKIVDAFGGVQITLTAAEAKALKNHIGSSAPGTYNLNGKQALVYARTRKIDTDRDRTGRQRKVLLAIAEKAKTMSMPALLSMLDKILPLVRTDMTKTQLVGQAVNAISYLRWNVSQEVVPIKSTPLTVRDGFEVLIIDWQYEVKNLHDMLYDPNTVRYETAA